MSDKTKKSASVTAQIVSSPMAGAGATPGTSAPSTARAVGGELPGSQFASLLAAIQQSVTRLDQKFSNFIKTEMKGAQEEAAAKAVKHSRAQHGMSWLLF